MFSLWCEYEYGQEGLLFKTEVDAIHFLNKRIKEQGDNWSAYDLFDEGLATLNEQQIYDPDH